MIDCMFATPGKEMVLAKSGPVVMIFGRSECTDEAWAQWCQVCRHVTLEHPNAGRVNLTYFLPGVAAPTAKQRKMLTDTANLGHMTRLAILSDSALFRGAIVALSWMSLSKSLTQSFPPTDYWDALRWLEQGEAFNLNVVARDFEEARGIALGGALDVRMPPKVARVAGQR
jgi:hypothetical protein